MIAIKKIKPDDSSYLGLFVLAAVSYKLVLDIAFINFVTPFYTEKYFSYNPDILKITESYILGVALTLVFVLRHRYVKSASEAFFLVHLILLYFPILSFYGMDTHTSDRIFLYSITISYLFMFFMCVNTPKIFLPLPGRHLANIILISAIAITFYVVASLIWLNGFELTFSLEKIYDARENLNRNAPFMNYFLNWTGIVILPFFLVLGIVRKKPNIIAMSVGLEILLFGLAGYKLYLMAPLAVAGAYYFFGLRAKFLCAIAVMTLIVLASYLIYFFNNDAILAPHVLVQRLLFTPARNHFLYYGFFSQPDNSFIMMSNSVLGFVFSYPYETRVPNLIALYHKGEEGGMNAGFLANAYANFGFLGMFGFSILMVLYLKFVDGVTNNMPTKIPAALMAILAFVLVNTALPSALLTQGFLVAAILFWGMPAIFYKDYSNKPKN